MMKIQKEKKKTKKIKNSKKKKHHEERDSNKTIHKKKEKKRTRKGVLTVNLCNVTQKVRPEGDISSALVFCSTLKSRPHM